MTIEECVAGTEQGTGRGVRDVQGCVLASHAFVLLAKVADEQWDWSP